MLLVSAVLAMCAALSQDAPSTRPQVPEHLAYPKGFKPKPGVPYTSLSVPPPMSMEEWEVFAKILRLSQEQRRALASTYDEYRRSDWAFRMEHVQPLYDRSAEIASQRRNQVSRETAAQRVALYPARDKVLPEISRIEQAFFGMVAKFLGESQLETLETVRLMRERSNDRCFVSIFPAFYFDLDFALISLVDEGVDVTPDDPEAFSELMHAWRIAAGSLYARHAEDARLGLKEGLVLRAEMDDASERGQADLAADLERRFMRVREPATRTARRILELHESYVELLAERLPAMARQRLLDGFHLAAYKPFTPDPCDLTRIFAAVEEQELSLDQQKRIEEICKPWRAADQAARDRMVADYLKWREDTCTLMSYSSEDFARYSKKMIATFDSRIASAEASMTAVLEILTKSQRREMKKHIDKWRNAVVLSRDEQEKTKARHGGWPAPME